MAQFLIFVVLGYLMGSISSAVLVCKMSGLPDPRTEGSKNPGATNVLRLAGKQYAALVMVGDVLKGTIPVLLAKFFGADATIVAFTGLAAVIGHVYPVFFGFKGGKGVATAMGALLGIYFLLGVVVIAIWLIVAKFWKYSSLASLASMLAAPLLALGMTGNLNIFPPILIMAMLIFYKHSNNINRLIDGTEPTIKLKKDIISEVMEDSPMTQMPVSTAVTTDAPVAKKTAIATKAKTAAPKKTAAKKPAATKTAATKATATKTTAKKTTKTTTKTTKAEATPVEKEAKKKPVKKVASAKPKAKKAS